MNVRHAPCTSLKSFKVTQQVFYYNYYLIKLAVVLKLVDLYNLASGQSCV
jgi:hypothetical protein